MGNMDMEQELIKELSVYRPWNAQEEADRRQMMEYLRSGRDVWTRENREAHMTASAWVTNCAYDKILMAYHRIYDSWAWLGGHADGERDLALVARREAMEESGIHRVRHAGKGIFSLEILTVDGHEKKGEYVSSHLHLNVTYLLEAHENQELSVREEENTGVAWFSLDDCIKASDEPWIRERIYRKLIEKMRCPDFGLLTENL